jgi:hypothetical protein
VVTGRVVVAVRVDGGDVRGRKVRGQHTLIRYHFSDRWSPHHELSYQTGEVEEWGARTGSIGVTDAVAGLPTWTLVYGVERGGSSALHQSSSAIRPLVLPPVLYYTMLLAR